MARSARGQQLTDADMLLAVDSEADVLGKLLED
jgi:hypothetical protein